MSGVPGGWAVARLADLADVQLGKMLDRGKQQGVPYPYLGNINVRWFSFELSNLQHMNLSAADIDRFQIESGDVLVCEGGEPGRCAVWKLGNQALAYQKALHRVRFSGVLLPELFAWQLRLSTITGQLNQHCTGSTIKHLPRAALLEYPVVIPPAAEQKSIADKLDSVLARVDACRDRLDRIPALLKRFRQSVLTAATSGQLTEDWCAGRDASEWTESDVQSVAQVATGSTPLRSNPAFYSESGTPWITSAATSQPLVMTAEQFVTAEAIAAHRLKVFPVGTLLVAMYGEGKTRGQVTELGIAATINQACAAVVVDESLALRPYLKLVLQANYLQMRELAEGGSQPNLNLSKIKEFPLPLPSLAEQHEIVRRVETLFAFVDRLEARCTAARKQAGQLTPALLAKAFRGELVSQDPADEPAAELLKRLTASRAEAPKARGRTPRAATTD